MLRNFPDSVYSAVFGGVQLVGGKLVSADNLGENPRRGGLSATAVSCEKENVRTRRELLLNRLDRQVVS